MLKEYEWLAQADRRILHQRRRIAEQVQRIDGLSLRGRDPTPAIILLELMQDVLEQMTLHRAMIVAQIKRRRLDELRRGGHAVTRAENVIDLRLIEQRERRERARRHAPPVANEDNVVMLPLRRGAPR